MYDDYDDNDGRFPEDASVLVKFPLPGTGKDREDWPWLPGTILGQSGPNEWHIAVDGVPELAETDPQSQELLYPACFRDASELRRLIRPARRPVGPKHPRDGSPS